MRQMTKAEIPTPALLVDLDIMEANIAKMAGHLRAAGKGFRPHAKTHKTPEIARACVAAGAVGTCTAKLSEAEAMASAGLHGLLITTAMIGDWRIRRAVALGARNSDTIFSADDSGNLRALNEAAAAAGVTLNIAIDLLVGARTGVEPGAAAVALAEQIDRASHLRLSGIQAFAGPCAHTEGFEARRKATVEWMGRAVETRRMIAAKGIACDWLSGGSTGTYNIDSTIEGVTEVQPGSFLFMDVDYARIHTDFGFSLTVLSTVYSKPSKAVAIIDAGFKAFSTDRPFGPLLKGGEAPYSWAGDEHGRLDLAKATLSIELGDRLEFFVPHCDPTVNLYNEIYATRGEMVEAVWKIAARGLSQ